MRFKGLRIANFRAIHQFEVADLADFIVIAGPNGCGKSCVLDAIRLLKSVYGGYQANEWMQWFGEFQIDLNDASQVRRLFRNPALPVEISGRVALASSEIEYLAQNAEAVVEPLEWVNATGQTLDSVNYAPQALATQYRQYGKQVAEATRLRAAEMRGALENNDFDLALAIRTDGRIEVQSNPTMEAVFQTFTPDHLGIIDYHSASRTYQREQVGGISLDDSHIAGQRRTQSLYNWQSKYANIKTELASAYIRDLISARAGGSGANDLNRTLMELFKAFFPDKEYLGVQAEANGTLSFPVEVRSGQVHDINELSSGEKEVVYGYLRLRNSTPRHSTILLDEPELHLNPGLLQSFPDFYDRNVGRALGNQLWLVTHSDTLLRRSVGNKNYSVFHMTSAATNQDVGNQAVPVLAEDALERATIDLVGDLATYRPHSKVILFEGGGDTELDVWMTSRLFPALTRHATLISGGGKRRVGDLYEVLSKAAETVGMTERFFVITDKDSDPHAAPKRGAQRLQWPVYHIENFLLAPAFVLKAMAALMQRPPFASEAEVLDALKQGATDLLPQIVMTRLQKQVNDHIVGSIRIGGDPKGHDAVQALAPSIAASFERLDEARGFLETEELVAWARGIQSDFESWLDSGRWLEEFPGRPILQSFVAEHLGGSADYEAFRNVIIDKMVDANHEPEGMKSVLNIILDLQSPDVSR